MAQQVPPAYAGQTMVASALRECRAAFWSVAVFSGVVNLLMLAGPIYMLQIYDRVLASRSVPTLVALTVFLVGAYGFQAVLDVVRSRIVVRVAALLDGRLGTLVHRAVVLQSIRARGAGEASQPVRDLDQVRAFLTSSGPIAIVDLPWVPVFLIICFAIHPWLGMVALAGAAVLLAVTIQTERASRQPARALARDVGVRAAIVDLDRRNSETAIALGMVETLADRWSETNRRYLSAVGRSTDVVNSYGSITKMLRLLLQSGILGLGAYLVIRQELSAGAMIAASIMMGRALAPIETAIANWRLFISARDSIRRLAETLGLAQARRAPTELPPPTRSLHVEPIIVAPPGAQTPILTNIRFRLAAGEALGVIGPSGSGKTSLVRTLVGVWPPAKGKIRLDGATLDQWETDRLGRHIGYVSQGVDLFDGTVAENIARMHAHPDSDAVLEAARAAGAHEVILRLPNGYDTKIGEAGVILSAGQRQRIALARALYGNPFLVALDEPGANLDGEGEAALQRALQDLKARGAIVVLVAHRPSALAVCDKVLVLGNGTQMGFGPRDEILQKVTVRAAAPAANLKVVSDNTGGGDR